MVLSHQSFTDFVLSGNGGLTSGEGGQHAQSSAGNAEHACQGEADVDGNRDNNAGNDGRLVAKGKAKNDVGSCSSAAGISNILHKAPIESVNAQVSSMAAMKGL